MDDATAKYTVTASAGSGGSISPTGTTTYLKRKTALYTITPDSSYYIQNVTVDGASVGAVKYYTFDPLYANHTIAATFAIERPDVHSHFFLELRGFDQSAGSPDSHTGRIEDVHYHTEHRLPDSVRDR